MTDLKFLISHYVSEIWRRRWSALILAWGLAAVGSLFAVTRPDVYEARAQVFVDIRELLKQLLNDDAYLGNPIEDVDHVRRLMYAKPNIRDIVHRTDMHLSAENRAQEDAIVNSVQEKISFTRKNRNHFFITFQHNDRRQAQAVVQAMLDLFLEQIHSRAGGAGEIDEALTLAERDQREVSEGLEEVKARIAEFERANPEALALPASVLGQRRRIEAAIAQRRGELIFQEGELHRLRAELSSTRPEMVTRVIPGRVVRENRAPPPQPPLEQRVPVPRVTTTIEEQRYQAALNRARQAQAQVDQLLRQYTPNYPGVRDAQTQAAQVQSAADALAPAAQAARQAILSQIAAAESYNRQVDQRQSDYQRRLFAYQNTPTRESRTPDEEVFGPNPRYAELQSQIGSIESRIAVTRQDLRASRSELSDVSAVLNAQPLKLQQYQEMTRARDDLQARSRVIDGRLNQLSATVRAQETELVRFEVIEPPNVDAKPVGPNRMILFAGAGLLAMGAGFGQAFARLQLADTLPTTTHLRGAFDLPVLGGVGKFDPPGRAIWRGIGNVVWLVGALALGVFIAGLIYVYHIKGARPDLSALVQAGLEIAGAPGLLGR